MSRPACFGSPVAVSHRCETCLTCSGVRACAEQAAHFVGTLPDTTNTQRERQRLSLVIQALKSIPHAADGVGTPQGKKRAALTPQQESAVQGIGKVAGSMARQLFERGWFDFARRELAAGRNPGRKDWQRILCDRLLRGGIERAHLQIAYQEQLGLTEASARVKVSKAVSVFLVGGLAHEVDGRIVFNPN